MSKVPLSFVSVGELLAPDEPDDGLRWHGPERPSSLKGRRLRGLIVRRDGKLPIVDSPEDIAAVIVDVDQP